ncbi:MAG TPA: ATP-binding protein [Actinomycetota bacterium]|nr:ATP-binding protein [Actinomycetota bacterium]
MSTSGPEGVETRPRLRALDLREEARTAVRDEALLRRVGERMYDLLSRAGFGAALVGTDGAILYANDELARMLGRDPASVASAGLADIIQTEDLEEVEDDLRRALSGRVDTFEGDIRLRHADGADRWAFLVGGLVRDARGRALGFALQMHDAGARKLEETGLRRIVDELRDADERKSRFVAEASHELRTPLTSVVGFAKTLTRHWEKISEDDKRGYIGLIAQQGERLTRLIGELLTLSRIDGGTLRVRIEPVDLDDHIERVVAPLPCADEIRVVGVKGLHVQADADHLTQILTNLLTNAFKYGASPVTIETRDETDSVEILVRDLGDGVPASFVPNLFDSFTRAEGIEGAGGTGLGLSIVRGLARAQGGEVWYEPNYPQGACFGIRLPSSS